MQAAQDFGRLVVDPEATTPLGSILSNQAALFRESTACSTWRGAVEKVRLNKARLLITQLASRGQRASSEWSNYHENSKEK